MCVGCPLALTTQAPPPPTPEDAPTIPRSPYAVSKLAAEHHCRVFSELFGLETVGSGRPVFWIPTLESDYWSTGNWTRTLTEADQRPCCFDFNRWRSDGDRGRGAYGADCVSIGGA